METHDNELFEESPVKRAVLGYMIGDTVLGENPNAPKVVIVRIEKHLIELEAKLDRLIELMSNREETE